MYRMNACDERNDKGHIMYTADECIHIMITVITEDPSKIIEALDDADTMIAIGADMGCTRHELMAEYLVHAIKRANPYLVDSYTIHDREIEDAIIAHLASIQK